MILSKVRIGDLFKSEFLRNASTLISGTVLAQVVSISTAPILARIYLPAHYGVFGVFVASSILVGLLSTLQYSTAIILPEKQLESLNILKGCLIILLVVTAFVGLIIGIFRDQISNLFGMPQLKIPILLMPIAIFFIGLNSCLVAYGNRMKQYKSISSNRFFAAILGASITILYSIIFSADYFGLIIGYLAGHFFSSIYYMYFLAKRTNTKFLSNYDFGQIRKMLYRYRSFPTFSLITGLINGLVNQLPIFLLSRFSGNSAVGHYNMSNRMLGLPIITVSAGISEVFRQKAAQDFNNTGRCDKIFLKTFFALTSLAIIPFTGLIIFGGDIFAWVFGENWRTAGVYSQIMGILFFFRFIVSPLTFVFFIVGKQRENLFIHLAMLIIGFGSMFLGNWIDGRVETMLLCFSIGYSLLYIYYFFSAYSLSKGQHS